MIMKLDELSGLIRVQIVRHSDGIPERFVFQKVTVKKQQTTKKHENYPVCNELTCGLVDESTGSLTVKFRLYYMVLWGCRIHNPR